jgi:hypothetical protein
MKVGIKVARTSVVKLPAMTAVEKKRLAEVEQVIEQGIAVFVEVGSALAEVRDSKLYRAEFKTFEAYCQTRWGLGRTYVFNLIESAQTAEEMFAIANISVGNEAQARELAKVTKASGIKEAAKVLEAVAADGKVTAKAIAAKAKTLPEPSRFAEDYPSGTMPVHIQVDGYTDVIDMNTGQLLATNRAAGKKESNTVNDTPAGRKRMTKKSAEATTEQLAFEDPDGYAELDSPEILTQAFLRRRYELGGTLSIIEVEGLIAMMNSALPKGYLGIYAQ